MLHPGTDPVALARAARDRLGSVSCYLADLDALAGAAPNLDLVRSVADLGIAPWVDAGLRDGWGVGPLLDAGAAVVIAGLETLDGPEALATIVRSAGAGRVVFSLDLRDGRPLVPTLDRWDTADPAALARRAADVGVGRILVLDVARVGSGRGVADLPNVPGVSWAVGGGVNGPDDLRALADRGIAAALVGSAIHDGRIGRADLDRLRAQSG